MADIYNQATWWSAVKPDAATDAVWDQEIARQSMTPIERAARALCQADGHNPDGANVLSCGDPFWMFYQDKVRTVIAAIREPSEGMVAASGYDTTTGHYAGDGDETWPRMIDALLAEGFEDR